jgi:chemotaxis protein histidine kinase CheA
LAELAALRTPDGTALLTRTFERLRTELPALGRRVREAGHGAGDLCRAIHDLAGVFALVGLDDARSLALGLEERILAAQPSEAEISTLLDLVDGLRARIAHELRQSAKTP